MAVSSRSRSFLGDDIAGVDEAVHPTVVASLVASSRCASASATTRAGVGRASLALSRTGSTTGESATRFGRLFGRRLLEVHRGRIVTRILGHTQKVEFPEESVEE